MKMGTSRGLNVWDNTIFSKFSDLKNVFINRTYMGKMRAKNSGKNIFQ